MDRGRCIQTGSRTREALLLSRLQRCAGRDFERLLAEVKIGRPSAWDRCYRWLAPAVGGYLRMQGARDPDDLTSEVFLAVFRNIGSFSGTEANFRSWVFVIAHRRLQDDRRRRLRRPVPRGIDEVAADRFDEIGAPEGTEEAALRAISTDRVGRSGGRTPMSRFDDDGNEMPRPVPFDDDAIDALVAGNAPAGDRGRRHLHLPAPCCKVEEVPDEDSRIRGRARHRRQARARTR